MKRALIAILSVLLLAATSSGVPTEVDRTIAQVLAKPLYAHSFFGLYVADEKTGETLIDRSAAAMFDTGSIMKVYSTAAALKVYGPDYRFRTPVYRTGSMSGGVLDGNLVLVASGDFSFGLRDQPDGTLTFNSFPELDHNYADTGFPGAALPPNSHPLAALDALARTIRTAGIQRVRGDVAIDERLFATYKGWPDGLVAPIWVNENVIDIIATPASVGSPATVTWRPKTAMLSVVSTVKTVAAGTKTPPVAVKSIGNGKIALSGEIAADAKPLLVISQIADPADFARVAFIEALRRAGVTVSASDSGPNPVRLLPNPSSYTPAMMVAQHVSPRFSQFVKVILKVSYNRGADLMVCLVAVKSGSRDCADGLSAVVKTNDSLGASAACTIGYAGA
ncbi:MAG: D-alanyl-D-alanine carboxypeptidase, partial [Candidatus Eremiobacteraeota bacterium]|nr:D-alanyl-D-alanine carboxypeptidase [Candidatus Eremiobacteraeota bacterium]